MKFPNANALKGFFSCQWGLANASPTLFFSHNSGWKWRIQKLKPHVCIIYPPKKSEREKSGWFFLQLSYIEWSYTCLCLFLFVYMGKHFFHWPRFSIVFDDAVGCTSSSKNILVKIGKEFKTPMWYQHWYLRVCLDAKKKKKKGRISDWWRTWQQHLNIYSRGPRVLISIKFQR